MKIYVGHSTSIDYKELYEKLKGSRLAKDHDIVLPHEESEDLFDSKTFLREECDLFLAEVSEASTGLGIELGWADEFGVPILCVYGRDSKPSSSLEAVTDRIVAYDTIEELSKIVSRISTSE